MWDFFITFTKCILIRSIFQHRHRLAVGLRAESVKKPKFEKSRNSRLAAVLNLGGSATLTTRLVSGKGRDGWSKSVHLNSRSSRVSNPGLQKQTQKTEFEQPTLALPSQPEGPEPNQQTDWTHSATSTFWMVAVYRSPSGRLLVSFWVLQARPSAPPQTDRPLATLQCNTPPPCQANPYASGSVSELLLKKPPLPLVRLVRRDSDTRSVQLFQLRQRRQKKTPQERKKDEKKAARLKVTRYLGLALESCALIFVNRSTSRRTPEA